MTTIIFGANGQDGWYLSLLLEENKHTVIGITRSGDFNKADITNYNEVAALVKEYKPDHIFHLAANSTTRHDAVFENHETIVTGTLNILEAVKNFNPSSKVFISGSGLQFVNNDKPIKETDAFEARNAYSVARIQSVYAARYYRSLGLKVYVGYFFNHDSPRRSERHIAKKIAAAVKRISEGSNEKIEIGDLSVIKEWAFAGDIVEALWLFVNQENFFEANISSGQGHSINDWVKACFKIINKNPAQFIMENRSFKAEYKQLVSDPTRIMSIGFKPKVSFEQLAQLMINGD